VPDKESDIVTRTFNCLVPFFGGEIADASAHPIMYAFLFQAVEVDNIHMLTPE
jgi:hypothetical protein